MGGGSSSPPPAPTISTYGGQPNYIPQFQAQNDQSLQNLFNQMNQAYSALPGQVTPQLNASVSNIVNNPYAAGAQQSANAAGGYLSGTVAPNAAQGAQSLQNLSNQASPYASQILQTGFDPQNALYNRTQQQVQDQLSAQNAMSGLSGTPYGAGVAGQGLSNFNIDWQNNLLNRQNAAAAGYGALENSIGQGYSGAGALGNVAAGAAQSGGALPYQTSLQQSANQIGGLGSLVTGTAGAYAPSQQLAGDYASYLGLGNAASGTTDAAINANYQSQLAQFNAQQQANQSLFGDIGGLFGGVTGLFSGGANSSAAGIGSAFGSLGSLFGGGGGAAAGATGGFEAIAPFLAFA